MLVTVCGKALEGRGLVLSCPPPCPRWQLGTSSGFPTVTVPACQVGTRGPSAPSQACPRPCLLLACPPHPGLMETEPSTQRDRGPGPFSCIALQEFRSRGRLGRGGATSGCGFKCVCFHSLVSPGPPSGPQGRKAALPTPAGKLRPLDPISPHLLLPGAQRGHATCLDPQPSPQTSAGFPSAPTSHSRRPFEQTAKQPHFWAASGCQHLAKPAPM